MMQMLILVKVLLPNRWSRIANQVPTIATTLFNKYTKKTTLILITNAHIENVRPESQLTGRLKHNMREFKMQPAL